ncbi:MAG TPA: amidase family protein [Candidatus Binataceae bacterium]|nr:amidase family protein [Candidatus Binataceae bacterium]
MPNHAAAQAAQEVWNLSAIQVAARIRAGSLRAEEYAAQLLERLDRYQVLNLVTWIDRARLLEQARAVDRRREQGLPLGPLAGLPIIIKDNIDTVGFATSAGTPSLKGYRPASDAPVVQALLQAGALVFAKANMHELALGGTSSNPTFGFVKNPYDPDRVPGGSSGGTAAAIAARVVPAGLGTDTAGSVRMPAAVCGIAGLRPSTARGRKAYSAQGVVPLTLRFDTIGPMARTVAEVALLDSVITSRPLPSPARLAGLRLGLPRGFYWREIDSQIDSVIERALGRLGRAGVTFVDVDMNDLLVAASDAFWTLSCESSQDLTDFLAANHPQLSLAEVVAQVASPDVKVLLAARDEPRSSALLVRARELYDTIGNAYRRVFELNRLDALLFPTVPFVTHPIARPAQGRLIRNTVPSGMFGTPGLNLPVGLTSDQMPVGMELEGLPGGDAQLLGLGLALEGVLGPLPAPR